MIRRFAYLFSCASMLSIVFVAVASARCDDGTLKLIRFPISTRPVILKAGDSFVMEIQNPIDIAGVSVELCNDGKSTLIYTSDPHDVFEVKDRSAYDLPSWDCPVDRWKMSWMWRSRVTVRDLVSVPVVVPTTMPAGFYDLRMRSSAGGDVSRRAVQVLDEWPTDYVIGHITDFHMGRDNDDPEPRARLIDHLNSIKPDFIVVTGDNTNHNVPEAWVDFLELIDRLQVPTFVSTGNHDMDGMVYDWHADALLYLGTPYYSFDYGEDHYVFIDNSDSFFDAEQIRFVKDDLVANRDKAMRGIFGHCLYQQNGEVNDWFNNELFPQHKVSLYLYGHLHNSFGNLHDDVTPIETKFDGACTWVCTPAGFAGNYTLVRIKDHKVASIDQERVHPHQDR